jgi:ABC-type transport system involved in multi-copper enzyme maturation permease subunit
MNAQQDVSLIALDRRVGPLSPIRGALRVARIAPLRSLRGTRLVGVAILAAIVPLGCFLLESLGERGAIGVTPFMEILFNATLTNAYPLIMLLLGAAVIGDDVEDGTLLFLRLRALPRSSIVVGRYLAVVISGLAVIVPSIVAQYLVQIGMLTADGVLLRHSNLLLGALVGGLLTVCGYGAIFLLLGLLIRRAVVVGLVVIVVSFALASLPSELAWISIPLHVMVTLDHFGELPSHLIERILLLEEAGVFPTYWQSLLTVALGSAAIVAVATWRFARREFLEKTD